MANVAEQVQLQREYYAATAAGYDDMHVLRDPEHDFAMHMMFGLMSHLRVGSVLDIGSGTGRIPLELKARLPQVTALGVEPSKELREIGYQKGLAREALVDGDAQALDFPDGSFDLVCEFGALHHIPEPAKAVSEMLRVAKLGIFISDVNNFGQGGLVARTVKQLLNLLGLWPVADFVKTRGKGYTISEGDGLAYSYSVFNQYELIRSRCRSVHALNLDGLASSAYRGARHVALFAIK